MRLVSRRRALQEAALAIGAVGLTPAAAALAATRAVEAKGATDVVPFFGEHQAGVATAQQSSVCFASLDLTGTSRGRLTSLLRRWSDAAARMTQGLTADGDPTVLNSPPPDSGEALGLLPARLTVTFGLGPSLFAKVTGLAARRPPSLRTLPAFGTDNLDPAICHGDLAIQACADDPYVAFHAVRMLLAIGTGDASLRWMLRGFTATEPAEPGTGRNLMGFKDGTANPLQTDPFYSTTVWCQESDQPEWMCSGSYLVVRRIRMRLGQWDASDFDEQQGTFGRLRSTGAPLTGGTEFTPPDFAAMSQGAPTIPLDCHIRRAHHSFNDGARILRRGYSFNEGGAAVPSQAGDVGSGGIDAGLLFLAYMRDPGQFIRIQSSLAALDHLNEYVEHVGSAVFAVPPGARPGGYVGETLLG